MHHRRLLLLLLLGIAVIARGAPAGTRDVAKLYLDFCSGCHGPKMEGGKGGNLVDSKWQHGGDDARLLVSIRKGYPGAGMPGFANALSEAETRAMITYIRETATHRIDPPKGEESPLPFGVQHSEETDYRIEVVADGLEVPWSFAFLPNEKLLVSERVGPAPTDRSRCASARTDSLCAEGRPER
ncbi:MAG: c-type cytochrome [Opitutus sp.]